MRCPRKSGVCCQYAVDLPATKRLPDKNQPTCSVSALTMTTPAARHDALCRAAAAAVERHPPRPRRTRRAPARITETAKSYRRSERQVRTRCAGDIHGLPSASAARETVPLVCVQRAELPVRTDVVCLPCAVNTCDTDSPSCHPSPCPCAASAKPNGPLLGKRDTAAPRKALPTNAATANFNAMARK